MTTNIVRTIQAALVGALSLAVIPGRASAAEIRVPADHPTIPAAVNAASNGDTIHIAPGVYTGQVVISNKVLALVGQPGTILRATTNMSPLPDTVDIPLILVRSSQLMVRGSTFEGERLAECFVGAGGDLMGIYLRQSGGNVENCAFYGFRESTPGSKGSSAVTAASVQDGEPYRRMLPPLLDGTDWFYEIAEAMPSDDLLAILRPTSGPTSAPMSATHCARHYWTTTPILMDNHDHLLLRTGEADLSDAIRWLQVSDSSRFNRARRWCGTVFQGRFMAMLIAEARSVPEVARPLRLNPVRVGGLGLGKEEQQRARVVRCASCPGCDAPRQRNPRNGSERPSKRARTDGVSYPTSAAHCHLFRRDPIGVLDFPWSAKVVSGHWSWTHSCQARRSDP